MWRVVTRPGVNRAWGRGETLYLHVNLSLPTPTASGEKKLKTILLFGDEKVGVVVSSQGFFLGFGLAYSTYLLRQTCTGCLDSAGPWYVATQAPFSACPKPAVCGDG